MIADAYSLNFVSNVRGIVSHMVVNRPLVSSLIRKQVYSIDNKTYLQPNLRSSLYVLEILSPRLLLRKLRTLMLLASFSKIYYIFEICLGMYEK